MKNRTVFPPLCGMLLDQSGTIELALAIKVVPRKASFVLDEDERGLFLGLLGL
ncbi:hypothetical protein [Desulfosporosinus lacus]|uniref:hypothetical protein n=1 Tax=Desulfosporosinus lacus TaxID=329936 RepID=UPI001A9A4910|nr:hypothetical protein [Desulfosporosinus lacus]